MRFYMLDAYGCTKKLTPTLSILPCALCAPLVKGRREGGPTALSVYGGMAWSRCGMYAHSKYRRWQGCRNRLASATRQGHASHRGRYVAATATRVARKERKKIKAPGVGGMVVAETQREGLVADTETQRHTNRLHTLTCLGRSDGVAQPLTPTGTRINQRIRWLQRRDRAGMGLSDVRVTQRPPKHSAHVSPQCIISKTNLGVARLLVLDPI